MFTGIVEARVPVERVAFEGTGARVWLPAPDPAWVVAAGESVAVCGTCLTVAGLEDPRSAAPVPDGTPGARMLFELSAETLDRTWFRTLGAGTPVNLERAMRLSDRLDGHLVSGHVDGGGRVVSIADSGDGGRLFVFAVDPGLERWLVDKGSITLDGISLTVVEPRGREFRVAVIPATLERTNLGTAAPDQRVNVEADLVGKWIERLLPPLGARG